MEYRGIQLHENVNLYGKNGGFNKTVKRGLDALADLLEKNNHLLKSKYKGNKIKIKIDYNCGHEPNWIETASYKGGVGCPWCAGNTSEQGKERFYSEVKKSGYILLSEYVNNKEKVKIQCDKGHIYEVAPTAFDRGNRCSKCAGLDPEETKKDFYKLIEKNGHIALTDYIKASEKVLIDFRCEHKPHWMRPNSYKSKGSGCPLCGIDSRANKKFLKSEKDFKDLVEKNGHILISEYKGMREKVQIDFQCEHEPYWISATSYYHRESGCIKCAGKCPELAKEELYNKIKENNHIVLSEYKGANEKILIHFDCSHEPHWIRPTSYKNGHGCPQCNFDKQSVKLSEESRKEFILLVKSKGHILLTEYGKNGRDKVLINFKCGHPPYWVSPEDYKTQKFGCMECAREYNFKIQREKSEKSAKEFITLVKLNEHILLTPYGRNNEEKVLIDFKCSHKPHWIAPNMYKSGNRCPECARITRANAVRKKGERLLIRAVKKNKHILLSEYKGAFEKVLIDFKCKHKPHWVTPDSYKGGTRCPQCSQPKGEKIICEWLETNGFDYKTRFVLPSRRWLYDIFIPSRNLIVEVQGKQHSEEVAFFRSRTLQEEQENDRNKREYAESLGYQYMEVEYREHKPKLALKRFLNEFQRIRKGSTPIKLESEQLSLF